MVWTQCAVTTPYLDTTLCISDDPVHIRQKLAGGNSFHALLTFCLGPQQISVKRLFRTQIFLLEQTGI